MLWITDAVLGSDVPHGMIVVHGHSVSEDEPVVRGNQVGIDTGADAYRTEQMTAIGIEANDSWLLQTRHTPALDLTIDNAEPAHVVRYPSGHGKVLSRDDRAAR